MLVIVLAFHFLRYWQYWLYTPTKMIILMTNIIFNIILSIFSFILLKLLIAFHFPWPLMDCWLLKIAMVFSWLGTHILFLFHDHDFFISFFFIFLSSTLWLWGLAPKAYHVFSRAFFHMHKVNPWLVLGDRI